MRKTVILVLVLALLLSAASALQAGTDVYRHTDAGTEEMAQMLFALGLLKGRGDGDFALENPMTREETAVMLVRFLGGEADAEQNVYSHPFTDVSVWADRYVGWLYEKGYTKGVSAQQFGGADFATCWQYSTMLSRAILGDESGIATEEEMILGRPLRRAMAVTLSVRALGLPYSRVDARMTCAQYLCEQGVFTPEEFSAAAGNILPIDSSSCEDGTVLHSIYGVPAGQYPIPHGAVMRSVGKVNLNSGSMPVWEYTQDRHRVKIYHHPNGDTVVMGRRTGNGEETVLQTIQTLGGTMRWYDEAAEQWQFSELTEGDFYHSMIELNLADRENYLLYCPMTYRPNENDTLEYLPAEDGFLRIQQEGDLWLLKVVTKASDGAYADYTMVKSREALLDWSHSYCGELWKNYTMAMPEKGRWCYDGYYWLCPENYEPSGEMLLYCCPASYLIQSFCYAGSVHRGAEVLAAAMLETMARRQNAAGFWETGPQSRWLQEDYGISAGFFDTRFNVDLIEIYGKYYREYGGDVFLRALERYADFFEKYAQTHHFAAENGGWFLPDYLPTGKHPVPHCSLNHHLAHCIELYRLSDILNRPALVELADKMLLAVEGTQGGWVHENGDLHYAVFPDGKFGLQDYPYLTYNDMFEMQEILIQHGKEPSQGLNKLMEAKKIWMDKMGVTGYAQSLSNQ